MSLKHYGYSVLMGWALCVVALPQGYAHDIPFQAPPEFKKKQNPVPQDETSIQAGGTLYRKHCAPCHGETGKGDGPAAKGMPHRVPDLNGSIIGQPDGEVFWKVSRGGGLMPPYEKTLSETERWQVIHFIRTLQAPKKGGGP